MAGLPEPPSAGECLNAAEWLRPTSVLIGSSLSAVQELQQGQGAGAAIVLCRMG